ncbi:hypothetical protein KAR04_09765 [Candidatus Calescamantes bacterium]|nr:hypothetical protein [Candidatus Calescamantes bacterium]MCK5598889.1 hypothetical protein [bacterium]
MRNKKVPGIIETINHNYPVLIFEKIEYSLSVKRRFRSPKIQINISTPILGSRQGQEKYIKSKIKVTSKTIDFTDLGTGANNKQVPTYRVPGSRPWDIVFTLYDSLGVKHSFKINYK